MSLAFLIPLAVGLGALSIYLRWADEGAPILGLVALIGLLTALVLAPWQVQAALLLLAVGLARYLLHQRSLEPATADASAEVTKITETTEITESTASAPGPASNQTPNQTPDRTPNPMRDPAIAPPRPKAIYRGIEVQPAPEPTAADRDRAIATPRPQLRYRGQPVDPPT
jgi:hypothetical protein